MRRAFVPTALTAALALVPWIGAAQGQAMDASRTVAGGGISVPGWTGKADGTASVETAKLTKEGDALPRHDRSRGRLLESRQHGERRLHRQGDVHRTAIHELEQPRSPVRHRDRRQRHGHRPAVVPLLRRVRRRPVHRSWVRTRGVQDERTGRGQRGDPQGRGEGRQGHPGHRGVGEGRPGDVLDQRHRRRHVRQGRSGGPPESSSHSTVFTASGSRTTRKEWSRASRRPRRRVFCSRLMLRLTAPSPASSMS